ncbi:MULTISPECIES: ClpXP protease specificity-enhancing factor [unclassified Arenimonas]|uniref:ClpXP protease specificity-enhancing factor n=1 Tax=unclassified Arenimonas TaxID=2641713 RepID=UPI00086C3DF0|nr:MULTISPECIES: ClpXP protease specificity-enhancing factor [unclassified Arenimonas]ODS63513.1 MAG: ClpXP protease specificity-enhancing factor [Arenimonas sp. SCN 70-307]
MTDTPRMGSNRPYLLRALNEWINDNGMTPHLLVDATSEGVQVPASSVKDGRVVLNIAPRAVAQLHIDNQGVGFLARFGGVSQSVYVPVSAVLAIYAQETGQGMMLPDDGSGEAGEGPEPPAGPDGGGGEPPRRSHLRVVK